MQSDPAEPQAVQPPSPEGLQELIDALRAASLGVSEAIRRVESKYKEHVDRLSAEAARGIEDARGSLDEYKRELNDAVSAATEKLTELETRSNTLASRLARDLASVEAAHARMEDGLGRISSTRRQVQAEREVWEAQARAAEARHEAAIQELRQALASEKTRIAALETANKRLVEANASLDERLAALEKKKLFGLF